MMSDSEEGPSGAKPPSQAEVGTDDRACTNGKEESPEVAVGDGEGAELVEVQDAAFPVKIQVPGVELFELQVRGRELAQSLLHALGEREETCQRTCYSLQLQGVALDPLSELGAVEGLAPGAVLRLIEEPYSLQDARVHVARLQELLRSLDPHDALRGRAGRSLSFLASVASGGCQEEAVPGSSGVKPRRPGCDPADCPPPGHILPGSKDRPLLPLQPGSADSKAAPCLLALALSRWSPPPGNRKLHGDLLYLSVRTVEGRSADITSCPRGFYINQSTPEEFHPQAASPSLLSHSLSDLLAQLSPAFKRGFTALLRKRLQLHPLERIGTPYQTYSWIAPSIVHSTDWDSCCWEEQAPGQTRDWNEELQASRELPQTSLAQRLLRDRALFKVNSDFVSIAVRGAVAVIDGGAAPLNPSEDPRLHVFLWGGVFLSLAGEGGSLGGERAARAVPRLDLAGVQAYSGAQGLHTLSTALLDYRGYQLSAQALVPGLLEREGDNRVCYGGSDSGRDPAATRRFLELLGVAAKPLRIQRHSVLQPSGSETTLYTSADCKGLVGNDGRYYILDLFKTFPPDLNFLPQGEGEGEGEGEGWPPGYTSLGFPREFPHKLCRLRPELVESFIQHKYTQFMNLVMERMQESQEKKHDDSGEGVKGVSPKDADPRGVDAVRAACRDVGSVSNIVFEIRFNPDASEPGVRIPDSEGEALRLQRRLLREAAVFLVTVQIPAFVSDCLHQLTVPVDGATLTEALHQRGINLRYMGRIAELISQSENKQRLQHVYRLLISETVTRSARRILNTYLQGVELSSLSAAVSHFLNCLLCSCLCPAAPASVVEPGWRRRRSRRRGRAAGGGNVDSSTWTSLTPVELWLQIGLDVRETFDLTAIIGDNVDHLVELYDLQKVTLLRELCVKSGIQLLLREYSLDSRQKPPFAPEDVLNIFPVVKRLATATSDGTRVFHSAQASLQRGCMKEGYQQLQKALSLFTEVCGPLHRDTCACLHSLAKMAFLSGQRTEAVGAQRRAVIVSERVMGYDHPNTINEYVHLALYQFSEGGVTAALRLLYRARYLLLLEHGEDHPYTATLDSNLGLILQVALQWEPALRFLHSALDVNVKFRGAVSLHSALSHHLLAQAYYTKGDFRSAVAHEREAHSGYRAQLGDSHKQTKASSRFLSLVTQQAVDLQRSLNEICRSGSGAVAPLQISLPSLEDTLEQLSLINGILCVSASINSEEPTNNSDATAKLEELASNQNKEVELLANETSDTKTDVPALVHQVELNTNEETATEALTNGNADAERAPPLPIQEEFSSDEETVIEDVTSEDRGAEKDMPTSNQEEILSDEKTSPSLVTNGNNPETDT
ncbi:clustered mitochondria protein homolog isoform X1 [Acipenser ruthenus]|uniref:clustered mitochondria protein homolog isoform X1 n=1 Tax=Acipenser ruthenus TaxID=7906 RepID=UPI00274299A2|nr:clustered mitochondria protein homolog isoform X1 [Acipenser ruthenus]